jgi:hypothetical protein
MTENQPIFLKDILGDPSHPDHAAMKDFADKVNSGEISVCACIGPVHGEPYCACEMRRRGLPPSAAHVAASEEAGKQWKALVESGALSGKA